MKRSSGIALQTAIVLFGTAVLVFLLGEPHLEGRNARATLFEIYFNDAFLAIAYAASIPFFVALYQAFRLIGDAGRDGAFSRRSVSALRIIRYCALFVIGFVLAGEAYLFIVVRGTDDIAGGVAMDVLVALLCAAVVIAMIMFEKTLNARALT